MSETRLDEERAGTESQGIRHRAAGGSSQVTARNPLFTSTQDHETMSVRCKPCRFSSDGDRSTIHEERASFFALEEYLGLLVISTI